MTKSSMCDNLQLIFKSFLNYIAVNFDALFLYLFLNRKICTFISKYWYEKSEKSGGYEITFNLNSYFAYSNF